MPKKPNIILIYSDNHPANLLGCYGNSEISTPHLDALASQSVRFTEAYSPNAMCSPCRASVLTGLTPSQHGIHTWLDDSLTSKWPEGWNAIGEFDALPSRLAREGYDTALIGKYHLGIADTPQNGFREWSTLQIGHVLSFHDNKVIVNGNVQVAHEHSVEFFSDRAIQFISEKAETPEQPFFMYLTYPAPYGHWPSIKGEPDNEFSDLYCNTKFESVPREGIGRGLLDWIVIRSMKQPRRLDVYKDLARMPNDMATLRNYYSQVSVVDKGVGRVLTALEESGLAEDTLVIYTSDHGMSLGQHGFWGHGEDTWPSNTHREANNIPLIVRPPGSSSIRTNNNLVGTVDIYATIIDYAGADQMEQWETPSHSLRSLIEGSPAKWDDVIFMEQEETRSIRTKRWLFMWRLEKSPYSFSNELYDLENDPDERVNLALCAKHQNIINILKGEIHNYFQDYSNPKWDLWKGGTANSNSTRPFLWKEIWGEDWEPAY